MTKMEFTCKGCENPVRHHFAIVQMHDAKDLEIFHILCSPSTEYGMIIFTGILHENGIKWHDDDWR